MNDASDSKEVRLEINIGASPETVFALLTDPTRMRTWLAEMVEANARPGGTFSISGPHGLAIRGGHEVVELWSNQFQKWIYVDGNMAWYAVDALGTILTGALWAQGRLPDSLIEAWSKSQDRWLRRSVGPGRHS